MINHHPTEEQLVRFASGEMNPAWSLITSAHIDMCEKCQQTLHAIQEELADAQLDSPSYSGDDTVLQNMMQDIMQLPEKGAIVAPERKPTLELDGKAFELPRALHRYANRTEGWSKLVGKIWQAPVELGDVGKAHFIYMEKGGSVPEHTHRGNELTLVVNGEFEDGHRCFDTGDFIHMDSSANHTPVSNADEGCLVFTFIDEPLHFTSGIARLLNPFSHLFFR